MREPPPIDRWQPLEVGEVVTMMGDAPFRWWVCGGHALELHAGRRWRTHADIDVGIRRDQAVEVFDWLEPAEMWLAASGVLRRWSGGQPRAERGENNAWVVRPGGGAWCVDITIGAGTDAEWVYRRDDRIRRPWVDAVLFDGDTVPYLAPELQLLFKSKSPRPQDDVDASEIMPGLAAEQRRFLQENLAEDHPWHALLGGGWQR